MMQHILLLGGSVILRRYMEYLRAEHRIEPIVLTSARQVVEDVGGETLGEAAARLSVRLVELPSFNAEALQALGIDLDKAMAVSLGAPWIMRQEVLDAIGHRVYNSHGTRLPQNRGGGTFSWQILRGTRYGFALLHKVDTGVDTGDIIGHREYLYDGCHRPIDYIGRYIDETLKLLADLTPALIADTLPAGIGQSEYFSSYWPRLNTDVHAWIDWSWGGRDIQRFVCAFDEPYAGAQTMLGDQIVRLCDCDLDGNDGEFHPFQTGIIYRVTEAYLAVCTTGGTLLVKDLRDALGKVIPRSAVTVGDRLFTPRERLETALRTRVHYTTTGVRETRR